MTATLALVHDTDKPAKPDPRTPAARARAQRDCFILKLHDAGYSIADLAVLTDLNQSTVKRILKLPARGPLLTPDEKRELRRASRGNPEALEWLEAQPVARPGPRDPDAMDRHAPQSNHLDSSHLKADRRRNGGLYEPVQPAPTHPDPDPIPTPTSRGIRRRAR